MTEEQQIEVWRKEFEKWAEVKCYYLELDPDGGYYKTSTRLAWEIWLTARRSMPVIELPEFFDDPDGCQLFSGSVTAAIDAAGYKYTIKLD